ncbi:MAG: polyketide cyclase [Nitrosopumilus sp.]
MSKFSLEKITKTKIESVFEIFSNYENYQKLFPQHYPSIRVRSVRGNVSVVEEHLTLGDNELVIMAKHVTNEPNLHEIFVIGGDAKGSYIKEEFMSISDGTKIKVDVDFKLKGKMMVSSLFGKNKIEENYDKILNDFIKIAEN